MRTEPYLKSKPTQGQRQDGLVKGAGITEIAVVGAALAGGIGAGIALDSIALGFIALIALALLARLVLALIRMDGDTGSSNAPAHASPRERVGS